ncbi:MAG TPA: DUF2723 domain-containing protein [Bacteroidia bacterium]|jgi:hypothetical protein|nr:DUF2723 domain-containing protein [Bacteroidia bacterium]
MSNGINKPLEQQYTLLNNILGWLVFIIAAYVYWATIEPTASFWDCSEFIAVDYKLQIGHPPGAPFLQLVAHLISLLTFGDVHKVAPYINRVSATCSALAIMFLFWTITYFAKKLIEKNGSLTEGKIYAILGSGLVGALAYTFTDSFWFSAVEGEVYAMSSCFTAMVFWCILKWERAETYSARWIVLTFYLVGLSIGVHLLCLLTIPAVVFVYYFKQFPNGIQSPLLQKLFSFLTHNPKKQGAIIAGIIAVVLLGSIQTVIIPGIIQLAADFEIYFVNKQGMHFNSGTVIFGITLTLLIAAGLIFTRIKNRPGWNTAILSFCMLLIGYSSFLILVIRANAPTPMDENNPSDAVQLHAYLGRQQYGDWPLVYGQYYNAPLDAKVPYTDGDPVYSKDTKLGKYIVTNDMKEAVPKYDSKFCTFLPRMWSAGDNHEIGYKNWGGTDVNKTLYVGANKDSSMIDKPTYVDNVRYFVRYQMNFMFWRYFMWNFCGRQNDIEGYDDADALHGNWITGIPFIDSMLGEPQENMPDELAKNKARNPMYGLPLLLGLLGFVYQLRKDKANALVITVLFFFTGLAIILYLNQAPYQPRERDYSYVGAFYAFAIWIGLGVLGMCELISKFSKSEKRNAIISTVLCMVVPVVMVHAEWDDHDRSGRYTCRDMAINYLESCAPNAILFTNGDNDTFPLWYAQEVEGIRTDVRVCNLSLLSASWYIDQMKRKAYLSDTLPISLTHDQYVDGTRDYLPFYNKKETGYADLKEAIEFIKSTDHKQELYLQDGRFINYFPTKNFAIKVDEDAIIKSHMLPAALNDSIVEYVAWSVPGNYVYKNVLIQLDMLANNDWKRPIYFAVTTGSDAYIGLDKYFQLEGMAYRLVPVLNNESNSIEGTRVATDIMYNNVMHKFRWGNMAKVYIDENIRRMAIDLRIQLGSLAQGLIKENKKDSALKVLNLCMDSIPKETCPYGGTMAIIDFCYYQLGNYPKANALAKELFDEGEKKLYYYHTLSQSIMNYNKEDIQETEALLEKTLYIVRAYNQQDLMNDFDARITALERAGVINHN